MKNIVSKTKLKNLLKEAYVYVMIPKKHRKYTLRELPSKYHNDIIVTNELIPKDDNYQNRLKKRIDFANKNDLDFRGMPKEKFKKLFKNKSFKKQEF